VGSKEFSDGGNHITIETHRVEFFSRFESKHKKNGGWGWGGVAKVFLTFVNKKIIDDSKFTP
jgi:hypothetical protein